MFCRLDTLAMWCINNGYGGCYSAARTTAGARRATRSRVRAAPLGWRRPCSQSCKVRTDTPISRANSGCVMPSCERALAASVSGTSVTRAACPAFICRTDSSSSC